MLGTHIHRRVCKINVIIVMMIRVQHKLVCFGVTEVHCIFNGSICSHMMIHLLSLTYGHAKFPFIRTLKSSHSFIACHGYKYYVWLYLLLIKDGLYRKYFDPMQSYQGKIRHSSRGAPSGGGGKQWEIPIIIVSQYLYFGQIDDHC